MLVALAVLVIRYGHVRYPYLEDLEELADATSKDNQPPRLRPARHFSQSPFENSVGTQVKKVRQKFGPSHGCEAG